MASADRVSLALPEKYDTKFAGQVHARVRAKSKPVIRFVMLSGSSRIAENGRDSRGEEKASCAVEVLDGEQPSC